MTATLVVETVGKVTINGAPVGDLHAFISWMHLERIERLPHGSSIDTARGDYRAIHSITDATRIAEWWRDRK